MTDLLERQLYTVGEAARLLRLPSSRLRRWLEGFTASGRYYEPVIRPQPTGSDVVTWAEFVEAGFLREYRAKRVSLQHLRPVIDQMRKQFDVRYPLAHFKPYVDTASRQLVLGIQRAASSTRSSSTPRGSSSECARLGRPPLSSSTQR